MSRVQTRGSKRSAEAAGLATHGSNGGSIGSSQRVLRPRIAAQPVAAAAAAKKAKVSKTAVQLQQKVALRQAQVAQKRQQAAQARRKAKRSAG